MFTHDANPEVDSFIVLHWLLLSVCAGIMNTVAFIGLGTFATHVTGFATLFGVNAAEFQIGNALTALVAPMFFLVGSVISGLCVEARVRRRRAPHYDYVMYLASFLLVAACVIGTLKTFDPERTLHLRRNAMLLSMICMASGLLNAALSYSSHSTVRITHLTGVTTDLGRGIAEMIALRTLRVSELRNDLRMNLLRGFTILAFMAGAVVSAMLFSKLHFKVLLMPAAYLVYAGEHGRRLRTNFRLSELAKAKS